MGAQPTHVSEIYGFHVFWALHPCPYISYYYQGPRMLGVETTFKIPRVKK